MHMYIYIMEVSYLLLLPSEVLLLVSDSSREFLLVNGSWCFWELPAVTIIDRRNRICVCKTR